ncbi:uncharacterized protein EHS24_005599, partial [Apiotrichum porosum]
APAYHVWPPLAGIVSNQGSRTGARGGRYTSGVAAELGVEDMEAEEMTRIMILSF